MGSIKLTKGGFRRLVDWAGGHPLLCAAVFFALAVAVRLLCNSFLGPIMITITPDEPRYLHLARSIADGGPLMIQGFPADFQKILYSLCISPAFLIAKDPLLQIKIVGIINVLLMSSMVFPVMLLVRRLAPDKPAVLPLTLACAVMLPDFIYTASFMSEVLYWPLSIWVFCFFHRAMAEREQRKRLPLFALLGLMIYLAYLTKEVGAAYLIAAIAVLAVEAIRDRQRLKQNALSLSVCAGVFFAALFAVRQALFPGQGNSYNAPLSDYDHLSLSILKSPHAVYYLLFSTAVLLMAATLSFFILPVLLPLFGFKAMEEEKRRIYLFSAVSLALSAGAIAYTASIRVDLDLGSPMPRWHLRMLAPLVIPFAILCFDFLLSKDQVKQKRNKMPALIPVAVFGSLLVVLLSTTPIWVCADHATLSIAFLVRFFICIGMDRASANAIWITFVLCMLAVMAAGVIFLLKGKKKSVLALLLCTITAVSLLDNVISDRLFLLMKHPVGADVYMEMHKQESGNYVSEAMDMFYSGEIIQSADRSANAAASVCEYIQRLDGGILSFMPYIGYCYIETYASQNLEIPWWNPEFVRKYIAAGNREYVIDNHVATKGDRVNYLIVTQAYYPFTDVEVVYEQSPYIVLKNLDPAKICFK